MAMSAEQSLAEALDPRAIIDPAVLADPYPFFERLRRDHPVWLVPGLDLTFVSTMELIVDALRRLDDFSNHLDAWVATGEDGRPVLYDTEHMGDGTTTLATADPPEHTIHRSIVFPELVARRMQEMRPFVEGIVGEHIAAARAMGTRVEWADTVAHPVPARVIGHLIGLPDDNWPNVMRWALHGGLLLAGVFTAEELDEITAEVTEAGIYLAETLFQPGREKGDDLIGVCARAVAAGDLDVSHALGTLTVLLGAGGESTASLIGNAVRMLAGDPGLQEQVRSDPDLIEPFIEEALRLESPFRGHYRKVKQDCELGGVTLKAGSTAMLLWASANRDPAEYERPDEVVLDRRYPRSHLTFGRGIHHCVGAPLARMETTCSLEGLLHETRWFTLADDDPPKWENSLFVRRHERLPLDITWN